jgi:hypothetical protein
MSIFNLKRNLLEALQCFIALNPYLQRVILVFFIWCVLFGALGINPSHFILNCFYDYIGIAFMISKSVDILLFNLSVGILIVFLLKKYNILHNKYLKSLSVIQIKELNVLDKYKEIWFNESKYFLLGLFATVFVNIFLNWWSPDPELKVLLSGLNVVLAVLSLFGYFLSLFKIKREVFELASEEIMGVVIPKSKDSSSSMLKIILLCFVSSIITKYIPVLGSTKVGQSLVNTVKYDTTVATANTSLSKAGLVSTIGIAVACVFTFNIHVKWAELQIRSEELQKQSFEFQRASEAKQTVRELKFLENQKEFLANQKQWFELEKAREAKQTVRELKLLEELEKQMFELEATEAKQTVRELKIEELEKQTEANKEMLKRIERDSAKASKKWW